MDFDEYQKKALSTATPQSQNITYRTLGLVGEAGEVAEKIKKWMRNDNSNEAKLNKSDLSKELGDVLWYVAAMADYLGLSMNDIAKNNIEKLADRKKRGVIRSSGDNR